MIKPSALDDEARAELLCYLVVGQLVAIDRTGTQLRTDHVIESARIWLANNGAECDWQERARLSQWSAELAPEFLPYPDLHDAEQLAKLFTDGWRLDYRSAAVQRIHDVCRAYLMRR